MKRLLTKIILYGDDTNIAAIIIRHERFPMDVKSSGAYNKRGSIAEKT